MSKLRMVLVHDLDALLRQRVGLALAALVPLLVLLLLGQQSTASPVRLLIAGADRSAGVQREVDRLTVILRESAGLAVSAEPKEVANPLARLERDRFDLLLNYERDSANEVSIYTAETDPARLARLEKIGAGILRASAVIASRLEANDRRPPQWRPLFNRVWWAKSAIYEDLFMLGTFPVDPLFEYYPQAADTRVNTLPALIAVILGLLPFLLMLAHSRAGSPPFKVSAWRDAATLALGRSVVASGITLMSFMILLIAAESRYGLLIKEGILLMMLLVVPASMASAFLGLGLSRLARSPLVIASLSMAYLIPITLLGGAATPLVERPWLVQQLGRALPSTLVQTTLAGWIFGARLDWTILQPLSWLLLQCLLYGTLATFALLRPASERDLVAEAASPVLA